MNHPAGRKQVGSLAALTTATGLALVAVDSAIAAAVPLGGAALLTGLGTNLLASGIAAMDFGRDKSGTNFSR